ncbi:MAG: hypothetical protein PWQ82_742 [Thermosediminibacterales bacterium]|nr:hypothetical protein [Thermosediminibacterales bacterium]MDK2836127.1 hypothetical protein [Thermosediminibacterales bacterium]
MNIIVCVKQVPDTMDVKIDPVTKNLIREGIEGVINPFDKNAIEEAVKIKDEYGGKVTAISMGPPQFKESLKEALAMGVDEAILISDRAFAGADTLATSYVLAEAIKKIGNYDLIFCGKHAVDADTGQVGPEIAERLGIPQITFVKSLKLENDAVVAERLLEDAVEKVTVKLPAVITTTKELNEPRYPSPIKIMKAARKEIPIWSASELNADPEQIGLKGSPTQVVDIFTPEKTTEVEMIQGTAEEIANTLFEKLREKKVL